MLASVTFLLAMVVSLARPPVPSVHDEFSYLLAADTFARGRLTNPTPECWVSFESLHIILQPSYASKYPPLQGMVLAVGQWVCGQPVAGVWLSQAIATAACYWMLLGWMPRRWADLMGVVLVLHPSIQILWGQSFWGGSLAFAAGALVWGGVPRLLRKPASSTSMTMATGAAMLAFCRPFEGLVTVLLAAGCLLVLWARSGRFDSITLLSRCAVPQLAVLVPALLVLGYYNHAVTGSAMRLPYMVHEDEYALSPNFVGQAPYDGRSYRHATIERFHREWAMGWYEAQDTPAEYLATKAELTGVNAKFFVTAPLAAPLLLLPWWRGRRIWPVLMALAGGWAASMLTVWSWPHYLAPTACLLLVVVGWGLRNVHILQQQWLADAPAPWRKLPMAGALVLLHVLVFAGSLNSYLQQQPSSWAHGRQELINMLAATGDRHLLIVDYATDHNTENEWVYNGADLEQAAVVWARATHDQHEQQLLQHYADRVVWRFEPDEQPPKLVPYRSGTLGDNTRAQATASANADF
jgi:hypothetical protein